MSVRSEPVEAQRCALEGIRILDFTQMMLGPLCTQMLADLGADVIKVERPRTGDWIRSMPMLGGLVGGDSAAFHSFNRNKRSLAIDLKSKAGREALLKIATHCDVVAENFRTGVMDRLGLGYEDFRAVNPKIIYASGSGWGAGSSLARQGWPGQDLLVQAMSGIMFNTGRAKDPPTPCGTPVADYAASQSLAIGILSAIVARDRHGVGQKVETNLFSSLLLAMAQENFAVLNQGADLERSEAGIASCWNDAPYGAYQTSDGWIAIAMCPLDKLGSLIGAENLGVLDAWTERETAQRAIAERISTRTTADWMQAFKEADVWAAPIRRSREVMEELVSEDSERLVILDHPKAGRIRAIGSPIVLSGTPAVPVRAAPLVGEHNREVLEAHLDPEEIEALEDEGAI